MFKVLPSSVSLVNDNLLHHSCGGSFVQNFFKTTWYSPCMPPNVRRERERESLHTHTRTHICVHEGERERESVHVYTCKCVCVCVCVCTCVNLYQC